MKDRTQLRKLFAFDCACAATGAAIHSLFFDFMIGTLSLPRRVVQTQLLANAAYAIYGAILYLSHTKRLEGFRFLAAMNLAYASLCGVGAVVLTASLSTSPAGALLLVIEGLIIASLARVEFNALRS